MTSPHFALRLWELAEHALEDPQLPLTVVSRFQTAATLSPPPIATWEQEFRLLLLSELEDGAPSLTAMARRMALSPRTLQRQLAERGLSWRTELDQARRQLGPPGVTGGWAGRPRLAPRFVGAGS
jgi:AraC-like DNA-binding protein